MRNKDNNKDVNKYKTAICTYRKCTTSYSRYKKIHEKKKKKRMNKELAFFFKNNPKNATAENNNLRSRFQLRNCKVKYAAHENTTWGRIFVIVFSVENLQNAKCNWENAT